MNKTSTKSLPRLALPLLTLIFAALVAIPTASAKQLYTCSMHPQIIREAPGSCPICGMTLVPVDADRTQNDNAAPATAAPASSDKPDAKYMDNADGDACCPGAKADDKAATPAAAPAAKAEAPMPAPAAAPAATHKAKYYKSTMMPGEVSPTPAKDSMGMDMVPVYEDAEPAAPAASGTPTTMLRLDSGTIQRMNLHTAAVETGAVVREVRTVGEIAFNERTQRTVTTKYDGWVERLYVNATWTSVKAGDPLFEIYSPELYGASLNYITARRSEGANAGPLTNAAAARLRLYDVPEAYLAQLATLDQPPHTFVIRATADGTVVAKNLVEGRMLKAGEPALELADMSSVWALAQVYEADLAFVSKGANATVTIVLDNNSEHHGIVSLITPVVADATRTNEVRIVLDNKDGTLRPGMYADVRISSKLRDNAVLVPDSAVLRSGERDIVFVALGNGRFEPREIKLGQRTTNNRYEVTSGLSAGETVVTSGQFMLDSESQLREAIQKMLSSNAK